MGLDDFEFVSHEDVMRRAKEWRDNNKDTVIVGGDFVKIALIEDEIDVIEHVWVMVYEVEEDTIQGLIANRPMYIKGKKLWDEITINKDKVEDHVKEDDQNRLRNLNERGSS
jgi:uncharacterized protein YegJ (DUF2314 family)